MKLKIITVFLLTIISCKNKEKEQTSFLDSYEIEWRDEFDGTKLDISKWAYRADNKHRSIQLPENVAVKEGSLVLDLKVLEEPFQGQMASGAGIVSKKQFRYGYYEVRAKLGDGIDQDKDGKIDEGWHHAFWAMAASIDDQNKVSTTYPGIRRTEIDGYENPSIHLGKGEKDLTGLNNFTQHIIVWDETGKEWGRLPKPPKDKFLQKDFDAGKWHTYGFEWDEYKVTFYVDQVKTKVAEYPSDKFVHDYINVWLTAIAANWTGDDQEKSIAYYDYFRFYKKKS